MRIRTTDFASGRTRDGRTFSAMQGAVLDADDTDRDKLDLFRSFVDQGVAELVDDEPAPEPRKTDPGPTDGSAYVLPAEDQPDAKPAEQSAQPKKAPAPAKKAGRSQ